MKAMRFMALMLTALMLLAMLPPGAAMAANKPDDMPYRIEVDISSQIVTVYENKTGEIARQMLCSTGMGDSTPVGNFVMEPEDNRHRKPWYWIGEFKRYVRYPARIFGALLFHSLPYTDRSLFALDKQAAKEFGFPASHGCARLRWQDARFISDNCQPGTAVRIYKSGERKESLRRLLYQESYDASRGFSYDNFLGISDEPGALSRDSRGQEVLNLQYRLRDLGLFDGEINGVYDSATINAVRLAQYMLDQPLTGAATVELREALYADDAPTAMNVALGEGMSGPAVRKLQQNLAALRLYDEAEIDSVYDVGVSDAVKLFQLVYGYKRDGAASTEVQKAIDYEAGKVRETFGDAAYECQRNEGDEHVQLIYVAPEDGLVYTVGCTDEDVKAGARAPSKVFAEYLAANEQDTDISSLVNFVTVDTQGQAPSLNLRQRADVDGAVLAQVPDGASLRVDRQYAEWTRVRFRGAEGYLMNRYLRFWTGPEDALDTGDDDEDVPDVSLIDYAEAVSSGEEGVGVFDRNREDARLLGHLPDGAQVTVLEISGDWGLIQYRGHKGYCRLDDLRLVILEDPEP